MCSKLSCGLWLFFVLAVGGFPRTAESVEWSYLYSGRPVQLEYDGSRIAVVCADSAENPLATLRSLCESNPAIASVEPEHEQSYPGLWLIPTQKDLPEDRCLEACATLAQHPSIVFASPALRAQDKLVIPNPNLLIALDPTLEDPRAWLTSRNLTVVRELPGLQPTFLVATQGQAFEVFAHARELSHLEQVPWAEPDFILERTPLAIPNDPLFGQLWHLDNTGQTGGLASADINAPAAWDISTGSPLITVAVLDDGVEVSHEDLVDNAVPGFDATNQPAPGGVPGAPDSGDAHGTAVAGMAVARGNNGIGVTGVAWNCKLMPIRIAYDDFEQVSWAVDGITWAADNGADVLCNAWGCPMPMNAHQSAIQYAKTNGRGGLGCPAFFAAGNLGAPNVIYPAAFPEAIAISGTTQCDTLKTPTTCDNVTWRVNYGPELDMVAPATPVVSTVMLSGSLYTTSILFYGTSVSTGIASGAAALLLSVDPTLTADEVQDLMQRSCDDQVGLHKQDTPGWDQFMGWGRINAYRMLLLATGTADALQGVTCTPTANSVMVSWQLPQSYDSIEVMRNGALVATLPGSDTSFLDNTGSGGPFEYELVGIVGGQPSLSAGCVTLVRASATELVWSPTDAAGPVDGGQALFDALVANGRPSMLTENLDSRMDLNQFERVWVNFGMPPNNHVITRADGEMLLDFVIGNVGGYQLYIEGGTTWDADPRTVLHGVLHLNGTDGGALGNVEGYQFGLCNFSGYDLVYTGEPVAAVSVPTSGLAAFWDSHLLQRNENPQFWVTVRHISATSTTREIIRSCQEFGGLEDSPTFTKNDLMAAYLECMGVPTLTPDSQFHRGDPNGDGSLDIADPLNSLSVLFGNENSDCDDAHDSNDDGNFDIADPLFLLGHLFSQGPIPPAPGPTTCGIDPTPDSTNCFNYPACP